MAVTATPTTDQETISATYEIHRHTGCQSCDRQHVAYPHVRGYLLGCGACEIECHCDDTSGSHPCVHCDRVTADL